MKILAFILFLLYAHHYNLKAQASMDTLTVDSVHQMTQLQDLYQMPGENYQLDHFVLFIGLPGIDPIAAYNRTFDLTANTIENIKSLTSCSKLSVQVYATNRDQPDSSPVKLPRKDYFIK